MADSCGAGPLANNLLDSLTAGVDFEIGEGNIPSNLTNADLTTGVVGGTGTFDVVMMSLSAHLGKEYDKGRITGELYTKAYIELTAAALQSSVQFLLGKNQSFWQSVLLYRQAATAAAEYGLTKMKIASEDANYCNLLIQKEVLKEQVEVQRAQTLDTRSDGITPVTGSVGKQKELYGQQIISYKRDSELKATKIFTDAWITMYTVQDGVPVPDNFTNASLNPILESIKINNEIGN